MKISDIEVALKEAKRKKVIIELEESQAKNYYTIRVAGLEGEIPMVPASRVPHYVRGLVTMGPKLRKQRMMWSVWGRNKNNQN